MERPDAVATIDFGSSLTRANAVRSDRPNTQEYITVLMAPEVAIVDPEEITDDWSMELMGPIRPENRSEFDPLPMSQDKEQMLDRMFGFNNLFLEDDDENEED